MTILKENYCGTVFAYRTFFDDEFDRLPHDFILFLFYKKAVRQNKVKERRFQDLLQNSENHTNANK
jgi:hypothetical protein